MSNPSFTIVDVMDRGLSVSALQKDFLLDEQDLQLNNAQLTGDNMVSAFRDTLKEAVVVDNFRDILEGIERIKTPLQVATQFINVKYAALNGAAGFLGSSTTAVTVCPDGIGYFRHFQGGSIYWHPNTGAHEVHGAIRQRWAQLGWEKSFLGYPRTDETTGQDPQSAGRFNHFQGGSIYWHPSTGAFEVHGAIRAKYLALGAEASFLGYPTTDETGTPDGRGRFNHFQAGSIYWTADTGAYEVHGLIRQYWASRGWERNPDLGYPISDELIPDRRIGHVHPETQRKPVRALPVDVIKLPLEARDVGFASVVTNEPRIESVALSGVSRLATSRVPISGEAVAAINPDHKTVLNLSANGGADTEKVLALDKTELEREPIRETAATVNLVVDTPLPTAIALGDRELTQLRPGVINRDELEIGMQINPDLIGNVFLPQPKSSPAPEKSLNRFSDFENGVLFWYRGATSAIALSPWLQSADGEPTHLKPQDVIAKLSPTLLPALGKVSGVTFAGIGLAGTTGYWFDGAGSHNRRHRFNITLMGKRRQRIGITDIEIPVPVILEVQFEAAFEPVSRRVVGFITQWSLPSGTGGIDAAPTLDAQLHNALDGLLWKSLTLLEIDDTEAGQPFAILSVKTMPDGQVFVFIEPKPTLQGIAIGQLVDQLDRSVLAVDVTP